MSPSPAGRPHLTDDAQDPLHPLCGAEAAGVGAHGLQDTSHEVQVMDGLCPHRATELWTHRGQVSRHCAGPLGPQRPLSHPTWCRCPQCSHSGVTGGPQAAENLTLQGRGGS